MQPQKTDLTHLPGSTPQSDHHVNAGGKDGRKILFVVAFVKVQLPWQINPFYPVYMKMFSYN